MSAFDPKRTLLTSSRHALHDEQSPMFLQIPIWKHFPNIIMLRKLEEYAYEPRRMFNAETIATGIMPSKNNDTMMGKI